MIDIGDILRVNGVKYKDRFKDILVQCPFREESNASLYIKKDTGIFHCFGCNRVGHFAEYLSEVTQNNLFETMKYIEDLGGFQEGESQKFSPKTVTSLEDLQKSYRLFKFKANRYLSKRGVVNPDIFECGYDNLNDRLSIPVRFEKKLIGFETRTMQGGNPYDKYKAMYFPKTKYLYGWDDIEEDYPYVVLVESAISVMYLRNTIGIKNVIAFMGTAVSEHQIELLKKLNKEIIFCWFDDDSAGEKAYKRVKAQLPCIKVQSQKDPDEYSLKEMLGFKEE